MNVMLSVIIPVYNDESHLRECLDSVLSQTLDGIEVICIDDGSTDGSLSVLREYAAKHGNVVVLTQKNATASVARNRGLAQARGEYVAFCDSDDKYATSHSLADLYQVAKKYGVGAAGGSLLAFREKAGDVWSHPRRPANLAVGLHDYLDHPFDYNYQNFIFKRDVLLANDIRFPVISRFQDPPFMVRAMFAIRKFVMTDSEVYHYRWGHQVFDWKKNDFRKIRDVFKGMTDVICFSAAHGLQAVVDENIRRLLKVYKRDFFAEEIPLETMDEYHALLKVLSKDVRDRIMSLRERVRTTPCVSVVIPSLNTGRYVRECLTSVVGQTLDNIEVICVDAGSTDGTFEILKEFEDRDVRVTVVSSERKSYGYQMNLGIRLARGEYISIVEPDDYIAPNMFERLYAVAKSDELDFVKSDHVCFSTESGRRKFVTRPLTVFCPLPDKERFYDGIVDTQMTPEALYLFILNQAGIYRRDFLLQNEIAFNVTPGASYQDVGFWLQTFILARRVRFLRESFYFYRIDNPNSSVHALNKVYCINAEYQFVLGWLSQRPALRSRFLKWVTWAKFANYNFTLTHIADEYIAEYVMRMYGVFAEDECSGALDRSLMNPYQRKRLDALLEDPFAFAASLQSAKATENLVRRMTGAKTSVPRLSARQIKSISCRGGCLRRAYQCYRDNGIGYTIRRIVFGKQRKD